MPETAQGGIEISSELSGISDDLGALYRESFHNAPLGFLPILTNPKIVQIAREKLLELRDLLGDMQDYNKTPRKEGLAKYTGDKYQTAIEKAKSLGLID